MAETVDNLRHHSRGAIDDRVEAFVRYLAEGPLKCQGTTHKTLFAIIVTATRMYVETTCALEAELPMDQPPTLGTVRADELMMASPGDFDDYGTARFRAHLALTLESIGNNLAR
jgi:hypothetical protein